MRFREALSALWHRLTHDHWPMWTVHRTCWVCAACEWED